MKRLLIIAYYYPPLGMGGVKEPLPYVKYMGRYGWRPEVLTVKPILYYAHDEELEREFARFAKVHRAGSADPARLLWLAGVRRASFGGGGFRHGGLLSRLQHLLLKPDPKVPSVPFFYALGRRLGGAVKYDALLVITPPFSHLRLADRLARSLHVPWVAYLADRWVDGWVAKTDGPLARPLALRGEGRALERARAVLCASPVETEDLKERYPAAARKVLWAPLSYDPELDAEIGPVERDPSTFLVSMVGTHRDDEGIGAVCRALARMAAEGPPRRVVLRHVGTSVGRPFVEVAGENGAGGFAEAPGQVPYRESLCQQRLADVLLLTAAEDNPHGLPGRTSDYVGAGRPILLVSNNEAARRTVERFRLGAAHGIDDEEGVYRSLMGALEGRGPLSRPLPEEARRFFAAPVRAEQLTDILSCWGDRRAR
jgi:glycosyltransferase involved in cell wall biosynthesis